MKKIFLSSLLGLSFLLSFPSLATLGVGDAAPSILLEEVASNGDILKEQDILKHKDGQKFTIVDFSSYNCGPCVKNLPNLKKIALDMTTTTTVRWVNTDRDRTNSLKFRESKKDSFVFPFSMDVGKLASKAFAIQYTPTMFILDENNKIIYVHIGTMTEEQVIEVEKMLR